MSSFDDEYALFKSEIEGIDSTNTTDEQNTAEAQENNTEANNSDATESVLVPDIDNELSYLKGHKCQAPYYHNRSSDQGLDESQVSYHNALVISVHTPEDGVSDINDIHVKVVFTHPIYKAMLTCPYFFDGDCKYSEERCFFSHGYLVKFIELQEYKNVTYDNLQLNQLVLAKNHQSNIWYRAKIINFNTREDKVIVQFETGEGRKGHDRSSDNGVEMELEDIYPLDKLDTGPQNEEDAEDNDSEASDDDILRSLDLYDQSKAVEVSLTSTPLNTRLGNWEKYTKGMGSKLMMKMGYVIGSGLGKNSEGRVEPVETYVLPQGKSLDYCMNLREKCGGGQDMFKMEKINQKMARKEMQKSKRTYENAVRKEKKDVFGFLNKHLNQTPEPSSSESSRTTNTETSLNVQTFQIAEKRKKFQKQLGELSKSLKRHDGNRQGEMYKKLTREISIVNNEIRALDSQDRNIHSHMKKQLNKKTLEKF